MKHYQSIGPDTLLPIDTPVLVGSKFGKVTKAEFVQSSNHSGPICLHTVKFTARKHETNLYIKIKRINPSKIEQVNYSFIKALI